MKLLLYTGGRSLVEKSGIGRAIAHQEQAFAAGGLDYTENAKDAYTEIHLNTVFPDSLWMARKARKQGKRVIYHGHSTREDFCNSFVGSNLLAPLFGKWLRLCYNSADQVVTPTPYAARLLGTYGLKSSVEVISNGVDTSFFCREKGDGARFRRAFGLEEEQPVVMSVGLPIARKGILDFLALAERFPQVTFFWFGALTGALLPPRIKHALQQAPDNVRFPGYVGRETLRDAYAGSDLFLFLTKEETEGIVVLEALSMKIPVLIRDIPVYDGWLEHEVNVYKSSSLEQFRTMMARMLQKEAPDLTEAGFRTAAGRDIHVIGQCYRQLAACL